MVVLSVNFGFLFFQLSLHLFNLLHGSVAVSEGLWVINALERSQYLVQVANASYLKPKACSLQAVAVSPNFGISADRRESFFEISDTVSSCCAADVTETE